MRRRNHRPVNVRRLWRGNLPDLWHSARSGRRPRNGIGVVWDNSLELAQSQDRGRGILGDKLRGETLRRAADVCSCLAGGLDREGVCMTRSNGKRHSLATKQFKIVSAGWFLFHFLLEPVLRHFASLCTRLQNQNPPHL